MDFHHLDEQQRRRADWRPGEPLSFGRHGLWHLPRVQVVNGLLTTRAGIFPFPQYRIHGVEATAFHDLSVEASESPDRFNAVMNLFSYVMTFNYDLDATEFASLVIHGFVSMKSAAVERTMSRMTTVAFNDPVNLASRLLNAGPRFKADQSGLLVGSN